MLTDPWQGRDPLACAGVDEVGRGSLFGPVFAGAVVLGQPCLAPLAAVGLTDSKKLTARRRADLVPTIHNLADAWALGRVSRLPFKPEPPSDSTKHHPKDTPCSNPA